MLPVTLSLPHALPMVQHILPVTFQMEVCSLPSSLEETDACTLQPIIQFVLILQTKSQIAHRQTYGSKLMLWFTWLKRGLRSCRQVCTTFVCSTAQFHCLNPPSICSGGDHGGSWSSKCCPKSWSLPLVHSCSELLLLLHHRALSWKSPVHMPSIFSGHAQHSKETWRSPSYSHCRNSLTSRRWYWALSPPMPTLFPGCQSCSIFCTAVL